MRLSVSAAGLVEVRQTDALSFRNKDLQVSQGLVFHGRTNSAALAANESHVQLFNPVGSAITVLVDRATVISTVAQVIRLTHHNTALTFSLDAGLNKDIGGAAPVGQLRTQQQSGFLGTEALQVITDQSGYRDFGIIFPILLGAGEGVLLVPTTQNVGLFVMYEWRELGAL